MAHEQQLGGLPVTGSGTPWSSAAVVEDWMCYVYLILSHKVWVESPCFLWSISVRVLHRDVYQDNQLTLWGTLFQLLEEGSSTCTTPVLHLSFFALHWSSDTGSMPMTYLRKLGERNVWRLHFARGRDRQIYLVLSTATAKSLQSCPTLCDPIDGSPLGSLVPGILQARTLEWVAISFSNA